ncbi:2-oxoacid:ferredoxin oxidoreductase subunit beta [Sedimentibacter sp. zth1]|uniref:2-oxoacid:ferredoxin oxidoreductase subunit beta n=1 Tax=Sedimentibacter sp. zth1 TaxID=2816908 RepID=UPI001A9222E8|nr:2-oxoacid:ferredoxin oxidoreductase subunit beta [Sedimentibacter sp. zth1]QSX06791.1 2-oxoacid:ferredoxin oxidoreductase subunit beta [Sedimentibacter sp. zth1]
MMNNCSDLTQKYYRDGKLPHIWCPGCGHGILLNALVRAIDNLGLDKDNVCVVSGIGCSSRATGYIDFNTLHTTHGRAIAYATGVKHANPDMTVIVVTGDGDCSAIGGNHLIHACRRNIDITTICFNNNIYGMTGGQFSPTTPTGDFATTAPHGNVDRTFDLCSLAQGAGATYVGRATAYHATQLTTLIENGIKNKGFSFIEGISVCPTNYGRKNKKGDSVKMLTYLKDNCIDKKIADKKPELVENKIIIGELYNNPSPEYTECYKTIIDKFQD